jgi:CRP-like cAMP-binding protein
MSKIRSPVGNGFLDALADVDFETIAPFLTERYLERDVVLHEPGEAVDDTYFPISCILSVITLMEDGRSVESCTIGRESAHGLLYALGAKSAFNRVVVQIGGGGLVMPGQRLREAATRSPALLESIARYAQGNDVQAEQSVACNALHDVESRLCRWILTAADRIDEPVLRLTQEYLAFMLGVQRTTVTAAAQALQAAGMISYRRGEITITDRSALEASVCECYGHVRQRFSKVVAGR